VKILQKTTQRDDLTRLFGSGELTKST